MDRGGPPAARAPQRWWSRRLGRNQQRAAREAGRRQRSGEAETSAYEHRHEALAPDQPEHIPGLRAQSYVDASLRRPPADRVRQHVRKPTAAIASAVAGNWVGSNMLKRCEMRSSTTCSMTRMSWAG